MTKKHLQPLTPAALYARVSSDRQDVDLSVAAQLRAFKEYAKANGYSVAREYVDEAESAHEAIKASIGPGGRLPNRALNYIGRIVRSNDARSRSLHSIPTKVRLSTEEGKGGYDTVQVAEANLDPVGRYIGCANGVVDLSTGHVLPPEEGKHIAVTLSTGIAYKPEARHPHVAALFSHLDETTAEYLKAVLGQGLYGMPDDIQLVLTGPGNGGKTTLLEAIKAAVGPSHFGTAPADVFSKTGRYSGGSHTEDKRAIYTMRYCQIGEAEHAKVDTAKAKQATSGSAPFRGIQRQQETLDARALIIWVANRMPKIGMDAPAIQRRTRIVDYPLIPRRTSETRPSSAHSAHARQPQLKPCSLYSSNTQSAIPWVRCHPFRNPSRQPSSAKLRTPATNSAHG